MSESKIKITVLLPVRNEKEQYLRLAIESILKQTYANFEFLIIDDESDDLQCLKILEEYSKKDQRIRLIHHKRTEKENGNTGLTQVLNLGLELAQGEFVARMDSDDIAKPNRLQEQLNFMEQNPNYVLCGTLCEVIDMDGNSIGTTKGATAYPEIKKTILSINNFVHSTWFFRRSAIIAAGGYAKDMLKAQDYELLLRLVPKSPVAILPQILGSYRLNAQSISASNNKLQEKYALRARWQALRSYGYPKIYVWKILRPTFFYFLIPYFIKQRIMQLLWKI